MNRIPNVNAKYALVLSLFLCSLSPGQWSRVPEIPETRTAYTLLAVHDTLYVGTDSLVYVGAGGGTQWFAGVAPSAGQGVVSSLLKYNGVLIAGMLQTGIFKSTDEGTSWQPFSAGLSGLGSTDISALLVRRDSLLAGTLGAGVFTTSTDFSHPWSLIGDSLASYEGENVFNMAIAGNTILAGGGANGYMFRYTDAQPWWNPISLNTPRIVGQIVSGMASNASTVVAATHNGVYRSTDEGLSWKRTGLSIPPTTFQTSLLFHGATLYAMSTTPFSSTLSTSPDEGKTWNTIGIYPMPNILAIAVVNDTLFAGGVGGVQRAPLSLLTSSVAESAPSPAAFKLDQNYPNPFNPTTNIGFRVPGSGFVSVKVYDALGREVRTLVNENLQPGNHEVSFDGAGLASGVYFYRLTTAGFSATRRFLLLK